MAFRIGGLVSAFLMLIGSFLPWVTMSGFGMSETVGGLDGDADYKIGGIVVLLLALVAGALFGVWKRATVIAAAGVSLLVLIIAIIDIADVQSAIDEVSGFVDGSTGAGLFVIVFGALAGIALGVVGQAQLAKPAAAGYAGGAAPWGQKQPWGQQPPASLPVQPQQPYAQPGQQQPYAQPGQQQPYAQQPPAQPAQPTPPAQPAQAAPAASAPAGWMPDPYGQAQLRYWDGTRWTEHTHNQPTA